MSRPRVLIVRAGALGDVLLLRPAIAGLRRAGFDVTLLAPSGAARVLEHAGQVDVLPWESPDVAALLADARACPEPLATQLSGLTAALAITRNEPLLAALRTHVGHVLSVEPVPPPRLHAARWYAQAAVRLGAETIWPGPSLEPSALESAQADDVRRALGDGYVVLHPGSGSASKNWSVEGFAALGVALGRVALVVGPADGETGDALAARLSDAVRLEGLPLRLLGAVLAGASLYVGNDSGVSHLAAAYGVPTLALFGPTDPATWAPVGPRVTTLRAPRNELAGLEADTVIRAAKAIRSAVR